MSAETTKVVKVVASREWMEGRVEEWSRDYWFSLKMHSAIIQP